MMLRRAFLLALPLLALPRPGLAQAPEALAGTWTVMVAGDDRHRVWTVTGQAGERVEGSYGWQGARARPVLAVLQGGGQGRRLRLVTPADSVIEATEVMPGRFEGVFTPKGGRVRNVALTRHLEGTATAVTARRDAQLMLVYLGAGDCLPCRVFSGTQGAYKQAFLASPEARRIEYREVVVRTFRDTRDASAWPAELGWLRTDPRTPARGTPSFLVVADRQVVLASMGLNAWETSVLPALRRLATAG